MTDSVGSVGKRSLPSLTPSPSESAAFGSVPSDRSVQRSTPSPSASGGASFAYAASSGTDSP
jgi:hypothetical protein